MLDDTNTIASGQPVAALTLDPEGARRSILRGAGLGLAGVAAAGKLVASLQIQSMLEVTPLTPYQLAVYFRSPTVH